MRQRCGWWWDGRGAREVISHLWGGHATCCKTHIIPVPTAARCYLRVAIVDSVTALARTAGSVSSRDVQDSVVSQLQLFISLLGVPFPSTAGALAYPGWKRGGRASECGGFRPSLYASDLRTVPTPLWDPHSPPDRCTLFFLSDDLCPVLLSGERIERQDDKIFKDRLQRTEVGEWTSWDSQVMTHEGIEREATPFATPS